MNWFSPIYNTMVGIIIGGLVTWITTFSKKQKEKDRERKEHDKNMDAGMAILLRTQLVSWYSVYQNKDTVGKDDWEDIESVYKVYKALGGNHTGDKIFHELENKHLDVIVKQHAN